MARDQNVLQVRHLRPAYERFARATSPLTRTRTSETLSRGCSNDVPRCLPHANAPIVHPPVRAETVSPHWSSSIPSRRYESDNQGSNSRLFRTGRVKGSILICRAKRVVRQSRDFTVQVTILCQIANDFQPTLNPSLLQASSVT